MIMRDLHLPIKCPKCGSENVGTKWTLNTIVAWIGRLLAVRTVKIFDKKCEACREEFQIFRK
jgi:predicted nucleic-acid-binding Zn-ribbon protein